MDGETVVVDSPAPERLARTRWLWVVIATGVVAGVAIILAILLTARLGGASDGSSAASDGGSRSDRASSALADVVEEGSELAASTSTTQLADPSAYSRLVGALATARSVVGGAPNAMNAAREEVVAAIDRVRRSLSAKALVDAQTDLTAVIGTAVEVNAGAAGRVPDDAVRSELQARVDAGMALLSSTAAVDAVTQQTQVIADQTSVVLAARFMGFREADGRWCASGGSSCIALAWPVATFGVGVRVELAGGENAMDASSCYETDEFRIDRATAALLYCPAGASIPDDRRASGSNQGDIDRDRLWLSDGSRLTELRFRS